MLAFDLHQIGLSLFVLASIVSLVLVVAKPLGKEFEATALVWIRAWKRIQAERRKPFIDQVSSEPPRLLNGIVQKGNKWRLKL